MNLNQQIIVTGADAVQVYGNVSDFLKSLAGHLKVESELPAGMAMISMGSDAPGESYQDSPWLELDESGNPIALKAYNGDSWVETAPDKAIKGLTRGLYVQLGDFEISHAAAINTWQDSKSVHTVSGELDEFKFAVPFKNGTLPLVSITPMLSSVHTVTPDSRFEYALGAVTNEGFQLYTKHDVAVADPASKFQFNFHATGEIEE